MHWSFVIGHWSFRGLLAAAAVLLLPRLAPARETTTAGDATFRVLCAALDERLDGLFYDHGRRQIPVEADSLGLSPRHPVPADGLVSFYRETPAAEPGKPPLRIPLAQIRLGPGGPWLVFLAADPGDPAKLRAKAVDQSWQTHPPGTVRIFNFCPSPLAIQAGQTPFELAPALDRVIPFPPETPDGQVRQLRLNVAAFADGAWNLLLSRPQRVPASSAGRLTWVLFPHRVTLEDAKPRVIVRAFRESPPAEPGAPET